MRALSLLGRSTWRLLREWIRLVSRRWLALLLFGGFTLVIAFWMHWWDPAMEDWVRAHQDNGYSAVAQQLSFWGKLEMAPLLAMILLAVVGFWRQQIVLRWAALSGGLAGCVGGIAVNILKVIVARPRPSTTLADVPHWFHLGYDYASFPSGHATHCMAIAAAVIVLAPRSGAAMVLASLAVGWSRWYLTRHYVTDVWTGSCLGLAIGLLFGLAARKILSGQTEYAKANLGQTNPG